MHTRLLSVVFLALSAAPALSANGICRGFNFQNDLSALGLYEISATGRTRMVKGWTSEAQDCPSMAARCRQPSFLIEGDKVVVNEIEGGFACANYVNAKGVNLANWLPLASLARTDMEPKWEGRWATYDGKAFVTINAAHSGKLLISGSAEYNSGATVNTGEFMGEGDASMSEITLGYDGNRTLRYDEAQSGGRNCAVRMRQLGPYIAVVDNGACGGLNVSFTGLYRKQ